MEFDFPKNTNIKVEDNSDAGVNAQGFTDYFAGNISDSSANYIFKSQFNDAYYALASCHDNRFYILFKVNEVFTTNDNFKTLQLLVVMLCLLG